MLYEVITDLRRTGQDQQQAADEQHCADRVSGLKGADQDKQLADKYAKWRQAGYPYETGEEREKGLGKSYNFV